MIAISGLVVRAGRRRILRGVNLDIADGSILGVVGESGSGKSTLAGAIMGLLPAGMTATGRIDWDGSNLLELPPRDMQALRGTKLAMIFQDPMTALNPLFTIGTHLRDVLHRRHPELSRATMRERCGGMLTRVGLPDADTRLDSYPHELSGGMRQRVVIAMALLAEPELLIADEPTTALDATVEAQIAALFAQRLARSTLFISHHLGLVSQLCDTVCVMYGGSLVETGPVAEVIGRPLHPYTQALLACEIDAGSGRLHTIAGEVPDPAIVPPGCIFAPRCPRAEPACLDAPPKLSLKAPGHQAACILVPDA